MLTAGRGQSELNIITCDPVPYARGAVGASVGVQEGAGARPARLHAAISRRVAVDERGASLVEFAIIMPLLFMLIIGMITGGLTLSRQNSVENAVREGTRFGAVNPNTNLTTYLQQVLAQVESAATGDLGDGVPEKQICVAFIDASVVNLTPSTSQSGVTSLRKSGSTPASAKQACFQDNRTNEARVQVKAHRESEIEGVFWSMSVDLDSQSVTRYERS